MIDVIKKNKAFHWSIDCQKLFEWLKKQFSTIPILAYFDLEKKCIVKTDASNNVYARGLS